MQIYPHWLDGEFVRISENSAGTKDTVNELVRALKLHALLGTQFVLNDVQVFDSAPILELFGDEEFRKFIGDDTDFLDLRVSPDPALGDSAFALAARGLARTQASGWTSSLFVEDAAPIRELGLEIINKIQRERYFDPSPPTVLDAKYPRYRKRFQAIRHAIYYFGMYDNPKLLIAPTRKPTSYYGILAQSLLAAKVDIDELAGNRELPAGTRQRLLSDALSNRDSLAYTINFAERNIENPDKRNARSQLLSVLDREPDLRKREAIWNNAVQAWNYATELTLQPDGGSVGNLPNAVSPSMYLAAPVDTLVPLRAHENFSVHKHSNSSNLPLNLDELSWTAIATARRNSASSMKALVETRARRGSNPEEFADCLRVHIKKLSESLEPPKRLSAVPYALIAAGSVGGGLVGAVGAPVICAVFGNVDAASVRALAPLAGAAVGMGFSLAKDWYRDSDFLRRRHSLTSTLTRAAVGNKK